MSVEPPILDRLTEDERRLDLQARAPGYTPEWKPRAGTGDDALVRIFARYSGLFSTGLNQTPGRSFLAFLDLLGGRLLPAEPARAPLVFVLMDNATTDPLLVVNSQVAAPALPQPASPLLGDEIPARKAEPAVFATDKEITLARARLAAFYSIDPGQDAFADHLPALTTGFTLFDNFQPVEHALYLGHDQLFQFVANPEVAAEVRFSVELAPKGAASAPLQLKWEYLSKDGWLPLSLGETDDERAANDTTAGFTQNGQIILRKICGPDAKSDTINGRESYWIRGVLSHALLSDGDRQGVPILDEMRARVSFVKSGLLAEAAATDGFAIDLSTNFRPFGRQPERYTTFYLGSKEVFPRKAARVQITFQLTESGNPSADIDLAWEYFDGTSWRSIEGYDFRDGTENFKHNGQVTFLNPNDWAETKVAGVANAWLRARIDNGNYGKPLALTVTPAADPTKSIVTAQPSTLAPPVVASAKLQYSYQTAPEPLDHCLTLNDFIFVDQTQACRWQRQNFTPFLPVAEQQPAVHFGFDRALPTGLVSLLVQQAASPDDTADQPMPAFVWEYRNEYAWTELSVLDETVGFQQSGMIQFIGAPDAVATEGLGGKLYRIRARLKTGERLVPVALAGLWLNAVWATHRAFYSREEVGVSDGSPGQTLYFRSDRAPVLAGEVIEVREWVGRGADWETAARDVPAKDLRLERDAVSGTVKEVWVRWHERPHLFASRADERHYVIERALGSLRCGDGNHGRIPTAGNRVVATYTSGGGLAGNVPAGAISELRAAVPFLKSVSNPIPAEGGAATESIDSVTARGAQEFRHGGRAISTADVEWIAREASPGVARARCLAVTGPVGHVQRGWITVVLLPLTADPRPAPTAELRRRVRDKLAARVPAAVAGRIRIIGPTYQPVGVVAVLAPVRPDETARVEARVRLRLDNFLHPLTGGPSGRGWAFGESLHASQIARVMEETEGVDYVSEISLRVGDTLLDESAPIASDLLIAAGDHELKLTLGEN